MGVGRGRVAGLSEIKASSRQPAELELGLGLAWQKWNIPLRPSVSAQITVFAYFSQLSIIVHV